MTYRELLQRQPVLPAPMCGISDYPFREICRRHGAALTTTQMVSSEAMVRGTDLRKSMEVLDLDWREGAEPEPLVAMQLFGADPAKLAASARVLEERGAVVIDLNMGCPANKITCSRSGSALLRDLPLVAEIFKALRAAVRVPLTVKMRWDWDDTSGPEGGAAPQAARMAQEEGFDGVCLHARTRKQGYSGEANWELIARLKTLVSIPVVGNGDIRTPADALEMMRQSGCDGVMIGRALIGDPWLLGECLQAVRSGVAPAHRRAPAWPERRETMLAHARAMVERQGPRGLVLFRKHAAAYLRGLPGAKKLRERLMHTTTWDELEAALAHEPVRELETGEMPTGALAASPADAARLD